MLLCSHLLVLPFLKPGLWQVGEESDAGVFLAVFVRSDGSIDGFVNIPAKRCIM